MHIYQCSRQARPIAAWLRADEHDKSPLPSQQKLPTDLLIGSDLVAVGGLLGLAAANGVTPLLPTNQLVDLLRNSPYGPALYISAYAARPLPLFPSSLLTIAGGLLFGPVAGIAYTLIGSNLSALIAYGIGHQLLGRQREHIGQPPTQDDAPRLSNWQAIEPYIDKMQEHPSITVLTMRFLFLPYDLVNYGAGMLGLDWPPFLLATALGSLPGTLAFVLAGASIQGSTIISGVPRLDLTTLAASGVIFAGSLAISHYLHWQQTKQGQDSIAFVHTTTEA